MYGNHFTFKEFIATETGLNNMPTTDTHLANIAQLWKFLNFVREKLGKPIFINSGYRTPSVNKQVGGAKRSYHLQGRAVDIRTKPEYMQQLERILDSEKSNFAEYIKYNTFFHIAI